MESLIGFLPLLLLLACPLMMVFCFWGMRRMDCATDSAAAAEPVAATVNQGLPLADRIAALESRLEQLTAEQDDIASELAELAWMEAAEHRPDQNQNASAPSTINAAPTLSIPK